MKKKDLTLIEVVVTIGIAGIVAAILIPSLLVMRELDRHEWLAAKMQQGQPVSEEEIAKLETSGIAGSLVSPCESWEEAFGVKIAVYFLDPSAEGNKLAREVFRFENEGNYAIDEMERTLTIKRGWRLTGKARGQQGEKVGEKTIRFLNYYRFPKQ